jgi:hypothetical protein
MTILNYTLDNGLLFWGAFAGIGGAMTWSFLRQVFIYPTSNTTTIETPTTDTGIETLRALSSNAPTPTAHYFPRDILGSVQSQLDSGQIMTSHLDKGVQTLVNNLEKGIQTIQRPDLIIDINSISQNLIDLNTSPITEAIVKSDAWLYPDHLNYLVWLANNPMTNTIADIIARPELYNNSLF